MKQPIIIFTLFLISAAGIMLVNRPESPKPRKKFVTDPALPLTEMVFSDPHQQMGKVPEGQKVNIEFHFRNTGKEILVITGVSASCGCTVAEKPLEPIMPGDSGLIKATFDSKGRTGNNHKVLMVFANTKETSQELTFDVEVVPADND